MIFSSKIIMFGVLLCGIGTQANAYTCKEPMPFDPEVNANQAFVSTLFERLHSDDPNQFIVYGQFRRSDERPLIHEIEHTNRMERLRGNNGAETEVIAFTEYTYLNVFKFDGLRIVNGEERQFSTLETIISVAIDGQFIVGRMPPTGKPVIGVMWEPDPVYHRIDNAHCEGGYSEITDEQYELLRACIGSNGCKP